MDLTIGELNGMEIKGIFSETMSCKNMKLLRQLRFLIRNADAYTAVIIVCVYVLAWTGCGEDVEDVALPEHMLEINGLSVASQTLNAGGTTTVTARVNYSGMEADLIYKWKASSGQIIGDGPSVTYLAPDRAGAYTITLELTDGFEAAQNSITVEVVAQALTIGANAYWPGNSLTPTLKYRISVAQLTRPDVRLQYEIVQDAATTGAFLSVQINGVTLLEEAAIGEVQPANKPLSVGEVDAAKVITGPGEYELTLSLLVIKAVDRGWLLQKAELIGAEGNANRL
jgi:hypothetical protein